jgi:hypothetical protein
VSFTDIEGNLAPEDCFLSRQIISHAYDDPATFLAEFTERAPTRRRGRLLSRGLGGGCLSGLSL